MARIPLGNFGNTVAPTAPQLHRLPVASFGSGGEGLIEAGTALSRIAGEEIRREEAERKAAEKTEAALLWTEHESSTLQTIEETKAKLQTGELSRDEALDFYRNRVTKTGQDALGKIAKDLQGPSQVKFEHVAARGERALQQAIGQHQRAEIAGNLELIRDNMLKQASLPGADVGRLSAEFSATVQALGPQAGLDAARVSRLAQDFSDTATFSSFKQRVIESAGSVKGLQALEEKIKTDPGLDSDKRLALLSSTQSQIATLQQRAVIEAERRDRENAKHWEGAVGVLQAGKALSPDYAADLQRRFKGTAYARPLAELMAGAPQAAAFAAQPLAAQDAALLDLQTKMNSGGATPADLKQYDTLEKAHRAARADVARDPWQAAAERGVLRQVAPLNPLDPATLPQQIAARREQAGTLAVWSGREVSLLRPDEAQALAAALDAKPAAQRAEMLGVFSNMMTPGQMRALSAQLGEKSPALATAGMLAAQGMETTKGRQVAEIYLRGLDAIKEKRISFDEAKQTKVRAEIHQKIEGVYASEPATRAAVDAVFGVYAGLKSEGESGDVNQAIRLATGGVMEINGGRIARPFGWSDAQVRDAIRAVKPETIAQVSGGRVLAGERAMTPQEFALALPTARLANTATPGAYAVIVGNRVALTAAGRPLLLPLSLP